MGDQRHRSAKRSSCEAGGRPSRRDANRPWKDRASQRGPRSARAAAKRRAGSSRRRGAGGRAVDARRTVHGRPGARRPDPTRADHWQPAQQCDEVHRPRRPHRDAGGTGRPDGRRRGQRQRSRHLARQPGANLRAVRAGTAQRCGRKHRPGHRAGTDAQAGGTAWRHRKGCERRAGPRQHVSHRAACGGRRPFAGRRCRNESARCR